MTARPTITEFVAGGLYGTRRVAAVFDRTDEWVRSMIAAGKLDARKLDGRGPWLVSGESVLRLYDTLGLPAAQPPEPVVPLNRAKREARALLNRPRAKA